MIGFCTRKFYSLVGATTVAMVVDFLMSLIDRVVAGNVLGKQALAGMGICVAADQFVYFVALSVALGASIRYLAAMGRFEASRARRIFSCAVIAAIATGLIALAVLGLCDEAYVRLFDADERTVGYALDYLHWYGIAAALIPVQVLLMIMVFADGDESTCLVSYPVQLGVNALMSWWLCRLYGTAGCGMGTVLGYVASIAVYLAHFLRRGNSLRFRLWFSFRELALMLKAGSADSLVQLSMAVMSFVLCHYVSRRFGSELLPVVTAIGALTGFSIVFDGVSESAQPMVEIYHGEGNVKRLETVMKSATVMVAVEGLVLSAVTVLFPEIVLRIVGIGTFSSVSVATLPVRLVGGSMMFWAVVALYNSYYQFIGRTGVACALTLLKDLLLPLMAVYGVGALRSQELMWLAYALSSPVALLLFAVFLRMRFGCDRFPLLVPHSRTANICVWDVEVDDVSAATISRLAGKELKLRGLNGGSVCKVPLIIEETLCLIAERNAGRRVFAEVSLDFNGSPTMVIRDDGLVFDLTDADQRISSFRTYLVAELMHSHRDRCNLTATGFNRNRFVFSD